MREITDEEYADVMAWVARMEADGTPFQDAAPLRAILAAREALAEAVAAAREAGLSWTAVALGLNTSRADAEARFG